MFRTMTAKKIDTEVAAMVAPFLEEVMSSLETGEITAANPPDDEAEVQIRGIEIKHATQTNTIIYTDVEFSILSKTDLVTIVFDCLCHPSLPVSIFRLGLERSKGYQ